MEGKMQKESKGYTVSTPLIDAECWRANAIIVAALFSYGIPATSISRRLELSADAISNLLAFDDIPADLRVSRRVPGSQLGIRTAEKYAMPVRKPPTKTA